MMSPTLFCDNCGAANQSQAVYCRSCGCSLQAAKPTIYHSQTGQLLANALLKQRYRIIAPIGSGGMGAVYQAEDTQLGNRKIAVKEMRQNGLNPQEQKEAADAFRQEAIMLAHLQHRNLPSIFDHFEENGRWYLLMSFIEGETLADYLSHTQDGKLPLDEALQIGMQLCTVLGYLHDQQPAIIFRDLKPNNIMRASDGHIYLIDFGIARHFKPGQAKDTAYYGSMGYAPPEQYGKAQTTPRSDIYSLGAVLHQLLSGHDPSTTPFRFPSLQSQASAISPQLVTLITQMLEQDENNRPTSMSVVKQNLQSIVTTLSDQARPLMSPAMVSKSATPPTVAASTPTMFPAAAPVPHKGTKNHGGTLLMGILGVIIVVGGFIYFTVSHQTASSNNSNETSSNVTTANPTQPDIPTPLPPTPTPLPPDPTPTPTPLPSYPQLASTYQGAIRNTTVNVTTTLALTSIVQNQQVISGNVIIGYGLYGSGHFTGTIMSDGSISFTDIPSDGSPNIYFSGSLQANGSLGGTYTVPSDNQQGIWQTKPV